MASESVQPIELDAQTVFSKLNGRLGYIQESVDKLNECRQNLAQQELASEIRDDLGAFERESHVCALTFAVSFELISLRSSFSLLKTFLITKLTKS